MSDANAQEREPEANPASIPDSAAVPSSPDQSNDLDRLLSEYETAVPKSEPATEEPLDATDETRNAIAAAINVDPLDQLLNEANSVSPDSAIQDQLRNEIAQRDAAEYQRQELSALAEFGQEIISRLPETLADPSGYVERELIALAVTDPTARAAFDLRNVDQQHAKQVMARCEYAWGMLQRSVGHPNRDALGQAIMREYQAAEIAANSKMILSRLQQQIISRARKQEEHRIDIDATADRAMVAQAVRGASMSKAPAEPAPDFGDSSISNREFDQMKKRLFRGG